MKKKVYTSLYLSERLRNRLEICALELDVDESELLSVLCYKAGKFLCKHANYLQTVEYQNRGGDYEITPVYFFASDHEYIHSCRLACKVSVSKLLSCAIVMFIDDILEKGINQMEIAQLRIIQNSYQKKTFTMRNFILTITSNDQFDEFIMNMRMKKTKKT